MKIPVFHDDQHGTAIISGAALLNAAELQGKKLDAVRIVFSGAGAAAISCARHYVNLGVRRENIMIVDSKGVVYTGRTEGMNEFKREFAADTPKRTLAEALEGADVFAGLSAGGLVSAAMVKAMAARPIIFAMANPDPEIGYQAARAARPDAIVATGRSDFPNQVNNVLGFPFIFRGALDVRAKSINGPMKLAATRALALVAKQQPVPRAVLDAYGVQSLSLGPEYIIPKPMDPRVLVEESLAVAGAAMESGTAQLPIADFNAYRKKLEDLAERIRCR
jgi:malate dehydrogenase (oxaloacetate-decarboxylating)(NADP+)